jgi:hypothetical protein
MKPRSGGKLEEMVAEAHRRFDAVNAEDARILEVDGVARPRELVQADRLEAWVHRVVPEPSLPLRLAARCQHLARFRIPRAEYPEGRVGYLTWRRDLAQMHAELAEAILVDVGFDEATREAVKRINLKKTIKQHAEVQAMEDALCLAFLEHELVPFIDDYEDEKIVDILRKSWAKMSERGHTLALGLPLSGRALSLVERALSAG